MSLFYDRDRNISGIELLTGLTYSPEYGSSVQFEARNNYVLSSDRIQSIAPLGLNSIVGKFALKFSLRENDAQKLINFYESQSGTGIFTFSDSSNIYKTLSGTIDSLGGLDSASNGKYGLALDFHVERNAPCLNWSGQSFVSHEFRAWQPNQSYNKYDIVWFEHDVEEPTNNWFYSLEDHTSSLSNNPLSTGQNWTTNLFEDSNEGFSVNQAPMVKKSEFKASFAQRINDQKNIHSFESIDISYKNISDKKTKSLLHFAESKLGYKRFKHQFPEIYNRPKLFTCASWGHQWNAKESNNLTLSLMEDPLGVEEKGSPSISITQQSGQSQLNLSVTGSGYCFYQTGDLKQLISFPNLNIPWGNTGHANTLKLFGPIVGLTGTGQSIIKSRYDIAKNLTHLNMSDNSIGVANLYYAPSLVDFNYNNNNVGGFDLREKPNLRKIQIQNNSATYLNIANSPQITGLYATGNFISGSYINETFGVLYSGGLFSGIADMQGNGEISNSAYSFVTGLTGRAWSATYNYDPYIEATTTLAPIINPTGYFVTMGLGSTAHDACNAPSIEDVLSDAESLDLITKINYSNTSVSGNSIVYVADGTTYYIFNRTCCGKGSFGGTGECPQETTEPPTTTTTTTTRTSTTTTTSTTTSDPCIYGCMDSNALNHDPLATCDDGSCIYP
jgi:phage-related protein